MKKWLVAALIMMAGAAWAADGLVRLAPGQVLSLGSSTTASTNLGQSVRWVYVSCSATCWVGSAATNVGSAASNPIILAANVPELIAVGSSAYVLTLRGATNGQALVTPVDPR